MAFFLFVRTIRAYYVDILAQKCYSENRKTNQEAFCYGKNQHEHQS